MIKLQRDKPATSRQRLASVNQQKNNIVYKFSHLLIQNKNRNENDLF